MRSAIGVVLLLLLTLPVTAQEPQPAPLVFFGDALVLMDEASGEVEVWDECAGEYVPRISTTGEWLALLSAAYDLRLCNLYTREVQTVDALPDTASSHPYSRPAWSPDSSQVAWIVDDGGAAYQIAVYDLETMESGIIVDALSGYPLQILWGQSGILVVTQGVGGEAATLYSASGDLLVDDLAGGVSFGQYFWVTDADGREYLGIQTDFGPPSIVDPATGIPFLAEAIELYTPLAPQGVTVSMDAAMFDWVVNRPDDEPLYIRSLDLSMSSFVPYPQADPHNIAIAPDGEAFVIFDLGRLLWRAGTVTALPAALPRHDGVGVIWAPLSHRVRGQVYSGQ